PWGKPAGLQPPRLQPPCMSGGFHPPHDSGTTRMHYDSVFKPDLFAGQTILVTGGGSGIGRCTAHELAALGAHVVLVGRKPEKLEKTAGEIVEDGGSASFQVCDIRDEEAVKTMIKAVIAERGRIHHLVNNAGGQFPAPLVGINQKGFEAVV